MFFNNFLLIFFPTIPVHFYFLIFFFLPWPGSFNVVMPGSEQNGRYLGNFHRFWSSPGRRVRNCLPFFFSFFFFSSPFCDGVNSLGILEFESPTHNCSFDFDSSLFIISACMRLVAWLIPRQLSRQPLGTFFARDMLHRQLVGCRGRQTRFCLCLRSIHLMISTKNGMHVVDSVC